MIWLVDVVDGYVVLFVWFGDGGVVGWGNWCFVLLVLLWYCYVVGGWGVDWWWGGVGLYFDWRFCFVVVKFFVVGNWGVVVGGFGVVWFGWWGIDLCGWGCSGLDCCYFVWKLGLLCVVCDDVVVLFVGVLV